MSSDGMSIAGIAKPWDAQDRPNKPWQSRGYVDEALSNAALQTNKWQVK